MFAPEFFTHCTMSRKYSASAACSALYCSGDVMLSWCFVLGFGGSKGHVRMHILASFTTLGICIHGSSSEGEGGREEGWGRCCH